MSVLRRRLCRSLSSSVISSGAYVKATSEDAGSEKRLCSRADDHTAILPRPISAPRPAMLGSCWR